jgi:hypothetical protein
MAVVVLLLPGEARPSFCLNQRTEEEGELPASTTTGGGS